MLKSLVLLFLLATSLVAEKSSFYVFAGQSNMTSRGSLKQVVNKDIQNKKNYQDVYIWDAKAKAFKELSKGLKGRFNVSLPTVFYIRQQQPEGKIFLMTHAAGGRPFHYTLHFKPRQDHFVNNEYAPKRDNFFPGRTADDNCKGKQYITLETQLKAAQTEIEKQGLSSKITAMFWVQGESDSNNKLSSETYDDQLAHLKKRIQEDGKTEDVPLYFARILPDLENYLKRERVRPTFIKTLHKTMDGTEAKYPGIYMIHAPADGLGKDFVHYTSQGYEEIGKRFAEKYLSTK